MVTFQFASCSINRRYLANLNHVSVYQGRILTVNDVCKGESSSTILIQRHTLQQGVQHETLEAPFLCGCKIDNNAVGHIHFSPKKKMKKNLNQKNMNPNIDTFLCSYLNQKKLKIPTAPKTRLYLV
jgi:hypothetical protein